MPKLRETVRNLIADGGTAVRSEESFRGLIPSVLTGYSRRTLRRGIDAILAALKVEAERRAAAT